MGERGVDDGTRHDLLVRISDHEGDAEKKGWFKAHLLEIDKSADIRSLEVNEVFLVWRQLTPRTTVEN